MYFRKGRPVTRLRRVLVPHPYGGEPVLADWDDQAHPPVRLELAKAAIGFGTSFTTVWVDHAESDLDGILFFDAPADIAPGDRVIDSLDGGVYDVHGWPKHWVNPFNGWDAGVTVGLKKVKEN